MITTARLVCAIVGLLLAGRQLVAEDRSEVPEQGVLFTGTSLATPPQQQGTFWKPPASLFSKTWLSALEELVNHGFADPRQCEYREVSLTWGSSVWGGCRLLTTHAWVIPQANDAGEAARRFAVTWDGLVYPVVKVGPAADLKADLENLVKQADKETAEGARRRFARQDEVNEFSYAYDHPSEMRRWTEQELVSANTLVALKCCMLLRLGEATLAEKLWAAWTKRDGRVLKEGSDGDPYMVFAWEWAWALFDRAVAAHLRGDDMIALHAAKLLVAFAESVPKTANQRGFKQMRNFGSGQIIPYLPLRDPPVRLLEETERRIQEGPVQRVLNVGLKSFPDQSERIAALIRDLEDISAGPEYELGDWPLSPPFIIWGAGAHGGHFGTTILVRSHPPVNPLKVSPVVRALIKEGDAAVEPLLECLVNDRRLTRLVGLTPSGGDLLAGRDFIGVDLAAYAALCGILQADGFGPLTERGYYHGCNTNVAHLPADRDWNNHDVTGEPSMELRRGVAAEIRQRWERVNGKGREEAWLAVLADRNLTCKLWLDAARRIVARVHRDEAGKIVEPKDIAPYNAALPVVETDDDLALPMAGEVLRGERYPSVTELLATRSDTSAAAAQAQESRYFDWEPVCKLTLCLARWDPKAAVPVIHRRLVELGALTRMLPVDRRRLSFLAEPMADLFEAGLQPREDEAIVQDYVAWLRATRPTDFELFQSSIFMPLWRHPDNPKMAELARWLFLAEESPWNPIHEMEKPLAAYAMIYSPLVGVAAFRDSIKRQFSNTASIGHFEIRERFISTSVVNAGGRHVDLHYAADIEMMKKSDRYQSLRACDFYALETSTLEGSPRYELYWPEKRREAARREMALFLDRWGNAFRDRSKCFGARFLWRDKARFQLPPALRPATAEDVATARAIFSLQGQSDFPVRVVPLKPYPSIARWKTYKELPLREPPVLKRPKQAGPIDKKTLDGLPRESFDREGFVWQAEEILVDGKWRRYYGFVGNHVIAKVPAEEIELLDKFSTAHPYRW
jgi:hypothetical protein